MPMTKIANGEEKRNQWHTAFYSAMHLEFRENKHNLLEYKSLDDLFNYDALFKRISICLFV